LLEEDIPLLGIRGGESSPEVMRLDDLAIARLDTLQPGDFITNEGMESRQANTTAPLMMVVIVIANVREIVTIIKNPDTNDSRRAGMGHDEIQSFPKKS